MKEFEEYLRSLYPEDPSDIEKAELYSLTAGGKRIRPNLMFAALKGYGLSEKTGYPAAAALEMIHTYSLIHDDLPAMDNDDLRRGRPTSHKVFGEAMAILAGDALLTRAFETLTLLDTPYFKEIVKEYGKAAGDQGMVLGQVLDLEGDRNPAVDAAGLEVIHINKTGRLIALPLITAAYLAGKPEERDAMEKLGLLLGLAFQVQDDIMDVTVSPEQFSKSTSDAENGKSTYVSILGMEEATKRMKDYFEQCRNMASRFDHPEELVALIDAIEKRDH